MPQPVTFLITDLDLGGAPLMLHALVRGLAQLPAPQAFTPAVVSLAPAGKVGDMIRAAGVPVFSLNARSGKDLPRVVKAWASLTHTLRPAAVMSILVHANLVATLGQPWAYSTRYIQSIHTLQPDPRWHWWLQGILSMHADAVVAPSAAILRKLAAYGPVPGATVIPNGIDIERFAGAQPLAAQALPWPATALVAGYVGRFDPVKRLDVLLRAAAKIIHNPLSPNILRERLHVALVGWGPEEQALRGLATALHIAPRVHFCGPTGEPEKWYKSLSCFCLPSVGEGFGLSLIEALAAGTPAIAAATPATREVAGDLVREVVGGDVDSLVHALQDVMVFRPLARGVLEARQGVVRGRFSGAGMVQKYQNFLQNFTQS